MRAEGLGNLKISKDPTENRNQDLPSCGAVPQSSAPLLAPNFQTVIMIIFPLY